MLSEALEASARGLDFSTRADLAEWMDQPCSYEQFRACLRDLSTVNRVTFAYRPTLIWLSRLLKHGQNSSRPLHIVDVGCGQGDMLRCLAQWAKRSSLPVRLTGIDLNPYSARAASERYKADWPHQVQVEWLTSDAFSYAPPVGIDIVISSLFAHHLADEQIVRFLAWMEDRARLGWFINDLHRQATPFHLFRLLATAMRWHPFVRHDGPVSIRRSFRPDDWERYLVQADIDLSDVSIEKFRPGRLCVGRVRHGSGKGSV